MGRAHAAAGAVAGTVASTAAMQSGFAFPHSFASFVREGLSGALEALKMTSDSSAAVAAAKSDDLQQAALKATLGGIEALRAEQSASRWRLIALVGAPVAVAVAVRFLGWEPWLGHSRVL